MKKLFWSLGLALCCSLLFNTAIAAETTTDKVESIKAAPADEHHKNCPMHKDKKECDHQKDGKPCPYHQQGEHHGKSPEQCDHHKPRS